MISWTSSSSRTVSAAANTSPSTTTPLASMPDSASTESVTCRRRSAAPRSRPSVGTAIVKRQKPSAARWRSSSMSVEEATVSFAMTRIVRFSVSVSSPPISSGAKTTAWRAPGTPYWYGPPTTCGVASKLKSDGGDDTSHSSVRPRQGFQGAFGP